LQIQQSVSQVNRKCYCNYIWNIWI
jgi:hypothetical protein